MARKEKGKGEMSHRLRESSAALVCELTEYFLLFQTSQLCGRDTQRPRCFLISALTGQLWAETEPQQEALLGEASPAGSEGWGSPRTPLEVVSREKSGDGVWGIAGGNSQSKDHRAFGRGIIKEPNL